VGGYLGPGVLSNGAGSIGNRGGQQVDLRYYVDASAVYDTGLQPYAVNAQGDLVIINGLYGTQLDGGIYGTHSWKTAQLGIDYSGNFYDYANASEYDGSTQNMLIGFTYQKSRHLSFDVRGVAGLSSLSFASPTSSEAGSSIVAQPTSSIFDNRYYYFQPTVDVNFIATQRTTITVGGDAFWVNREGVGLASENGWTARGTIQHRLSRSKTIGVTYSRMHMDFSPNFGYSDINVFEGIFGTSLGRRWTFNLRAGAFQSDVSGLQSVILNPVLAALLGQSTSVTTFYHQDVYPSGQVNLTAHLKKSSFMLTGGEQVSPGNGVYLTSRLESAMLSYSYTGIKKWSFGIIGGYSRMSAIGQAIQDYATWNGGANATYGLTHSLHAVARFDARDQQINVVGYKQQGYRTSIGIAWSPGDIPLSLW
jgi:hypothetical protein